MHVHTSEVSPCASVPAAKVVKKYYDAGYNGMVLTDHMCSYAFKKLGDIPWKDKVDYFLRGYHAARAAAPEGFTVLLGMEVAFTVDLNDYLVYGVNEEFIYNTENLLDMELEGLRNIAEENNLMIFQAHPFRKDMQTVSPYMLDGIEVYNGNSSHNSSNEIAMHWADRFSMRKISGSDFHSFWGMKPGGVVFDSPIKTNEELIFALHNNKYHIK